MAVSLEEIMLDPEQRLERGPDYVREVIAREGIDAVLAVLVRLIDARDVGYRNAALFVADGQAEAKVEASASLRAAVASLLASKSVHDRFGAIFLLERLPMSGATELLAAAARSLLASGDILSVARIVAFTGPSTITADLLKSDDWLFRWAVLSWTNTDTSSALSTTVRAQLAADPHPLVAAEAAQHIKTLEALEGGAIGVASNTGRALSFRTVTSRFVAFWPLEKTTYTLEELRAFVEDQTKR